MAAGPVLFERLDWRPFGIRPVLPIAATQPPGEATRLDSFRAELTRELLSRLSLADADVALAEALDRWELSLFQHEPFRSEQLRGALAALLGETWELRAAVLLGDVSDERRAIHAALRCAARRRARVGAGGDVGAPRARRGACGTATGSSSWRSLDDTLLGLRAAPRLAQTA